MVGPRILEQDDLPQSTEDTSHFYHFPVHLPSRQPKIPHHGCEVMSKEDVVRSHVPVNNAANPTFLMEVTKGSGSTYSNFLSVLPL